ncbi:YihY/virulence factor BrkB family protein [Deinococcus sonorensis]|uniref:YihY/virulence factor BrkB family protein n=2 Tax=Deinococcus sonorensis TaxID=309891 RepID=A0AAU7UBU7_9DEIO
MKPADLYALVRDAALAFSQDNAPRLSAALAYYAFSAVAPLLFLVTVIAGYFLGQASVQQQLLEGIGGSVSPQVAEFIRTLLPKAAPSNAITVASIIGAVTVFLTATGLFVQLQASLNSLWGSDPPPVQNLWTLIRTRLIAFALVVFFGALIIAFLAGNTYLSAIAEGLGNTIGLGAFFVRLGSLVIGSLFFTPVFAVIYKFLPAVKLQWREVWIGAAITATLFTIGQTLIGLYFGRTAASSAYGAAGALFLMLLWIYYSSMLVFFGAEITWVYSQRYGTQAGGAGNPTKKAAVAQQGGEIGTHISASEAEAIRKTPPERLTPSQRLWLSEQTRPPEPPVAPPHAKPARLSIRSAIGNAVLALLALPSVLVLRLVGLFRRH